MKPLGGMRLARLLDRHRDAVVVEPERGRPALVRRDQLLVGARDVGAVDDLLRRWVAGRDEVAGVTRFRLREGAKVDVCELVDELHGESRHRCLAVAPNHLMHGEPHWWGGPADAPSPAPPLPVPTASTPRRQVTVAILDTGLSAHPWFDGKKWYVEQRDDGITEVLDVDLDSVLDGQAGHGTFIAGVILQRAPAAALRIHRLLDSDGVCDELHLVRALTELREWSQRSGEHIDLVNLSFGCYTFDDRPSPLVAQAIARLGRQTTVVACAGNSASDRPFWPAALKSVVAVAALDAEGDDRASFSNYGWWVDACSVGEHVQSSFVLFDGPKPPADEVDPDLFLGYARWSGTSFAAPQVTGALAALCGAEDVPAAEAADRLLDPAAARTLPDLGVVVAP